MKSKFLKTFLLTFGLFVLAQGTFAMEKSVLSITEEQAPTWPVAKDTEPNAEVIKMCMSYVELQDQARVVQKGLPEVLKIFEQIKATGTSVSMVLKQFNEDCAHLRRQRKAGDQACAKFLEHSSELTQEESVTVTAMQKGLKTLKAEIYAINENLNQKGAASLDGLWISVFGQSWSDLMSATFKPVAEAVEKKHMLELTEAQSKLVAVTAELDAVRAELTALKLRQVPAAEDA